MKTRNVILALLTALPLVAHVAARIGARKLKWEADHKPKGRRSLRDLSGHVFEELRDLNERGLAASFQLPQRTRRLHRIIVEGSANEGQEFNDEARRFALEALRSGTDQLYEAAALQQKEMRSLMRAGAPGDDRSLVSRKEALGIVIFTLVIIFLVTTAVANIVAGVSDATTDQTGSITRSGFSFVYTAQTDNRCSSLSHNEYRLMTVSRGMS